MAQYWASCISRAAAAAAAAAAAEVAGGAAAAAAVDGRARRASVTGLVVDEEHAQRLASYDDIIVASRGRAHTIACHAEEMISS